MSNGYRQYLSSPYTRVELSLSQKRSRQVGDAALNKALEEINGRFKNVDVELLEWPEKLQQRLGKIKQIAFLATPVKTPAGKLPLLISLHGGGQRWWNMSLQEQLAISAPGGKIEKLRGFKKLRGFDLAELAGKGMILLEPNTAGLWDADSLDTMLDYVLENYPEIDKDRVYVMGYSMGGRGTWAWINESADRFAAAAPCGFNPADTGDVKKLVKLPIWAMAGGADGDRTTGVRKMVERLRAAGNVNVKHTEFEGADHRAGLAVFSSVELVEWMLGIKRPRTTE
jgi:predicted peptidase